jgi:hypothetical protein
MKFITQKNGDQNIYLGKVKIGRISVNHGFHVFLDLPHFKARNFTGATLLQCQNWAAAATQEWLIMANLDSLDNTPGDV